MSRSEPKIFGPFIEGQICRHQGRGAFIALGEDLEQELRAGLGEGHEAELVDDQEAELGELRLPAQQPLLVTGFHKFMDQRGGRREADGETPSGKPRDRARARHGSCRSPTVRER